MEIMKRLGKASPLMLLLIFLIYGASSAQSSDQEKIDKVKALTAHMKNSKGQMMRAASAGGESELNKAAKSRLDVLEELVQTNPQAALDLSLPATERVQFPADVQKNIEEEVTKEGYWEVMIADDFENRRSTTYHALVNGSDRYPLHFAEDQPQLMSGAKIRVKGVKIKDRIAVPKQKPEGVQK